MKASQLINELSMAIQKYGDLDIKMYVGSHGNRFLDYFPSVFWADDDATTQTQKILALVSANTPKPDGFISIVPEIKVEPGPLKEPVENVKIDFDSVKSEPRKVETVDDLKSTSELEVKDIMLGVDGLIKIELLHKTTNKVSNTFLNLRSFVPRKKAEE
jgi:hypothetical protein